MSEPGDKVVTSDGIRPALMGVRYQVVVSGYSSPYLGSREFIVVSAPLPDEKVPCVINTSTFVVTSMVGLSKKEHARFVQV